jgi:hypothetical protein
MPSLILNTRNRVEVYFYSISCILYCFAGQTVYKVFIVGRDCLLFDTISKYF